MKARVHMYVHDYFQNVIPLRQTKTLRVEIMVETLQGSQLQVSVTSHRYVTCTS
ncbi:hypothetical protein COCC4DRAFT_34739, partial [Bipolaris maydis ATCC 48331]